MTDTETGNGGETSSPFEVRYAPELLLAIGVGALLLETIGFSTAPATGIALGFLYIEAKRHD